MPTNRYDEVECIRCHEVGYVKDMRLSRPECKMLGASAEWICESCYHITDCKTKQHLATKNKHWAQVGARIKKERESQ